jgi:hypothetical protein
VALHTAMIAGVQVPGFRYVVFGLKRGYVSTHRTKRAALRSLAEDARTRMKAGQPSDAQVYRWRDGWVLVNQELDAEPISQPDAETHGC